MRRQAFKKFTTGFRVVRGFLSHALTLLALVIALNTGSMTTWGQEHQSKDDFFKRIPTVKTVVFQVNNDASFTIVSRPEGSVDVLMPPRFDEMVLLAKPWVQDELKLTVAQRSEFQDTYDKVFVRAGYEKRLSENLTDTLDKDQQELFRDLLIRCRIRAMGFVPFFSQPALELPDAEVKAIKELIAKLEPGYNSKIMELRDQTIEALLAHLTDEQRQNYSQISAGFLDANPPPMALLFWQLSHVDSFEEVIVDKDYPNLRGLFLPFFGVFYLT